MTRETRRKPTRLDRWIVLGMLTMVVCLSWWFLLTGASEISGATDLETLRHGVGCAITGMMGVMMALYTNVWILMQRRRTDDGDRDSEEDEDGE